MPRMGAASMDERPGLFVRAVDRDGGSIEFTVDGSPVTARAGDSLLAAILTNASLLRRLEFGGEPRAGFCLMGACQDCLVWLDDGRHVRACTTAAVAGLGVRTTPPALAEIRNV
jgi:predicted molibdopterin-dependent oxidoreductase YjgC